SPGLRVLVVLAVFGGLAAFLFWPRGLTAPREENRTMHPSGYSIIVPPEWEARVDAKPNDGYAKDRLHLRPIREGHWQPEVTVTRLRKPPDAAELKSSEHFTDGRFGNAD